MTQNPSDFPRFLPEIVGFYDGDPDNYDLGQPGRDGYPIWTPDLDPSHDGENPWPTDEEKRPDYFDDMELEEPSEKRAEGKNKLQIVYDEERFFPTSGKELTEVLQLRKYRHKPGGAARYLNVVLLNQHKEKVKTDDPTKAVRAKGMQWHAWCAEAISDEAMVLKFEEHAQNFPTLSPELLVDGIRHDGSFEHAVRVIETIATLNQLAQAEEVPKHPYELLKDPIRVGMMSRNQLKEAIWQARLATEKRREYWQKVEQQAYSHMAVRQLLRTVVDMPPLE